MLTTRLYLQITSENFKLNIVDFNTKRDLVKINADKSEIINYKCKDTRTASFDGQEIAVVTNIKHLGINRNNKNTVDVDNRLQTARKIIYSLLSPGLHARRYLSPLVSNIKHLENICHSQIPILHRSIAFHKD